MLTKFLKSSLNDPLIERWIYVPSTRPQGGRANHSDKTILRGVTHIAFYSLFEFKALNSSLLTAM